MLLGRAAVARRSPKALRARKNRLRRLAHVQRNAPLQGVIVKVSVRRVSLRLQEVRDRRRSACAAG